MKKFSVILLLTALTHNSFCQNLKFRKITSVITAAYLLDDKGQTLDTLELKNIYKDKSYARYDSSIFFTKMFVTTHSFFPVVYYLFHYKVLNNHFVLVDSLSYRIKKCNRDSNNITDVGLKFAPKGFVLSWKKDKEKNKLIIPLTIFNFERAKAVLPECW